MTRCRIRVLGRLNHHWLWPNIRRLTKICISALIRFGKITFERASLNVGYGDISIHFGSYTRLRRRTPGQPLRDGSRGWDRLCGRGTGVRGGDFGVTKKPKPPAQRGARGLEPGGFGRPVSIRGRTETTCKVTPRFQLRKPRTLPRPVRSIPKPCRVRFLGRTSRRPCLAEASGRRLHASPSTGTAFRLKCPKPSLQSIAGLYRGS